MKYKLKQVISSFYIQHSLLLFLLFSEISLPPTLTNHERAYVHLQASKNGFVSKSYGYVQLSLVESCVNCTLFFSCVLYI